MKLVLLFIPVCVLAAEPDFDSYWHDGKAELDGYRMTISRYGQPRHARGVAVYVTEPFSNNKRVKVDDPSKDPSDVIDVLKLNLVRDFQTGIYDYNTMVSVFVRTDTLSPVKISFSSAEWCGHVYNELLFYHREIDGEYFSYFERESKPISLAQPLDGVTEDALWILLRGLRGDFLKPGEKRTFPFLPGVYFSRLNHKPLAWTTAEIAREGNVYTVKVADGRTGKFVIEPEYPHRIARWEMLPDISAELTGSARLEYWRLHDNGNESYLQQLGLKPRVE